MVFLYPEFLWGLLALVIPILIHLFDFRKTQKVYFSDIRFLKQVKQHSSKPLKLKHWLILLARLGFIFFLVLLFAQPVIPDTKANKIGKGALLIYIDNSQSMSSMANTKQSLLEAAKVIAQEILEQVPKDQELIILTNDEFNRVQPTVNIEKASEKVASIPLSDKAFSLQKLSIKINEFARKATNLSDVFIIGDFQKSTSKLEGQALDTTLAYWVFPLMAINTNNCVVDTVFIEDANLSTDGGRRINVVVVNNGSEQKEELPIKIFLGDRQVSAASITIPAYQKKNIIFSLGKVNAPIAGYVQLEDYPNIFDDKFNFSLPTKRLINVLQIVGEQPSSYIKPVFGNESIFSFSSNNHQNLESKQLEESEFIILNQVRSPSVELMLKLKQLANLGTSVLIIPPKLIDLSAYQILSNKLGLSLVQNKQKLKVPSAQAPFFKSILEKSSTKYEMPSATNVLTWGKDRSALLAFEDDTPYLSEVSSGLFLFGGPISSPLADVQTHALFVPIMYELASQSSTPSGQLFSRLQDEYFDLNFELKSPKHMVKLTKENIDIIPNKQQVGGVVRLSFPKEITRTGSYKASVQDSIKAYLSINLEKEESLLTPLVENEISPLFFNANVKFLDKYNPNQSNLNFFNSGISLWSYALTICLLFLAIETLLIRFL